MDEYTAQILVDPWSENAAIWQKKYFSKSLWYYLRFQFTTSRSNL